MSSYSNLSTYVEMTFLSISCMGPFMIEKLTSTSVMRERCLSEAALRKWRPWSLNGLLPPSWASFRGEHCCAGLEGTHTVFSSTLIGAEQLSEEFVLRASLNKHHNRALCMHCEYAFINAQVQWLNPMTKLKTFAIILIGNQITSFLFQIACLCLPWRCF